MTYAQLDKIADAVNPLLILGVLFGALYRERAAAWPFIGRAALATVIVQQSSKIFQHAGLLGRDFPSTHFAVALCLTTFLVLLNRRLIALAVAVAAAYAALILWQRYHTPLELVGALYAIPVAWSFGTFKPRKRAKISPN